MDWLQIQAVKQWLYLGTTAAAGLYFVLEIIKSIWYFKDRIEQARVERAWREKEESLGDARLHADS